MPFKEAPRPANRAHSPVGGGSGGNKTEGGGGGMGPPHREIQTGARRIGSGRILSRDVPWDYQEGPEMDNDFGYGRRERRDTDRDRDDR